MEKKTKCEVSKEARKGREERGQKMHGYTDKACILSKCDHMLVLKAA